MDQRATTATVARRIHPAAPPLALVATGLLGAVYLWGTDPYQGGQLLPRCPVHWATGLLCPGCGGTRMSYDLLHLDLAGAWQANPVLLTVGVPLALFLTGRWLVAGLRGRRYRPRFTPAATLAVLAVAVLWTLARNLLL
ncbi:DUF2752 domain-containing protein [Streptomyces profundus]|uniref:DUF2752 domain-containing protein n=1 Tax=Streptomyces profundus TaxID=2867410 RepID=UPI001D1678EC|nr:DUF2752 domain-containing protein [Streptomyces sp. MA3_2.13]UED82827.1 DUF2752 domain-containing protein [Streptomyces sp. MA3_2.13]